MSLRWPYSKWMMRAIQVTVKQPRIVISYNPWGIAAVSTYYLYCVSYFLCCFRQIFYSLTEVLGFISYIRQLSYNSFCPRLNIRKSLHHAPPCSKYLKAQNKLIINYSNSCWGEKKGRPFSIFKSYNCSYCPASGILRSQETGLWPRLISGKASDHSWKENTPLFCKIKSSYICSQMTVLWILKGNSDPR